MSNGSVRKRGKKWYYSIEVAKVGGKRKRIERVGGDTQKEAKAALRKALLEFEETGLTFSPSNISVSDYFDYWFEKDVQLNCRYNTQLAYKNMIEKHIKPNLGIYPLKKLTPAMLQEFINSRFINGASRTFLVNLTAVLGSALKAAVYPFQFIKENPITYVKMPKYEQTKKEINRTVITKEVFKAITDRFDENSKFYIMLMIGYYTGMRIGEVIALTWDDINFEEKTINIDKILYYRQNSIWAVGAPKTKTSERVIVIGDTLLEILKKEKEKQKENREYYKEFYKEYCLIKNKDNANGKEYKTLYPVYAKEKTSFEKADFVCRAENGDLVTSNSFKYVTKVVHYELGLQFNFHSLRHTHATMLIENGANLIDVQRRLGHSRPDTTAVIYTHPTKKMAEQTVEIFEKYADEKNPGD